MLHKKAVHLRKNKRWCTSRGEQIVHIRSKGSCERARRAEQAIDDLGHLNACTETTVGRGGHPSTGLFVFRFISFLSSSARETGSNKTNHTGPLALQPASLFEIGLVWIDEMRASQHTM